MITLRPKTFKATDSPILSDNEIELLTELQEVDHPSFWGVAIRDVVKARKVSKESFRNLVCQLKSQAFDQPTIMQSIIGVHAYELLVAL